MIEVLKQEIATDNESKSNTHVFSTLIFRFERPLEPILP